MTRQESVTTKDLEAKSFSSKITNATTNRVVERTTDGEVTPGHTGQGHRILRAGLGRIITDLSDQIKMETESRERRWLTGVPLARKHGAQTDQPLGQG